MKKNVVLAVVCLFTVVSSCGCLESQEGNILTMTLEELVSDYNESVDNDTKKINIWFESLNEGDAFIIRDTLYNITYSESHDYTLIEFESLVDYPFPIEGNLMDTFRKGDTIELKMHIVNVTYTQQNPYTGEIWTFEVETFKEGWDNTNNTSIPIPQKYLRSLDKGKSKEITMTMDEFIHDAEQHMDNDTRTFSSWQKSLNEGDTLIIRDTLNYLIYNESDDITFVEFESSSSSGFPIEGDITDTFKKGDSIGLKVHIIEATFTQQVYDETWTITLETFKEGWDSESNTLVSIPQTCINS